MRNQPGSSENRRHDVRWNLIMNRYGKPVLSPNYRPDIPGSGRPVRKKSLDRSVTVAHTSRSGTRLDQVGRVRVGQPRRPLVWGVGVTSADSTGANRGRSFVAEGTTVTDTIDNTIPARYNTPNDVSGDGDWHKVVTRNRYVKPMRTQDYRMGVSEMDDFETYGTTQMVVADDPVCVIKPDGEPAELLAGVGLQSDNNMDSHVRCLNCHKRKRQYGTMWNSGHVRKPLSERLRPWSGRSPPIVNRSPPIVTQRIPPEVMEPMHHEWILRKSVTNTDMTVPCNYLEIPDPILPNAFLHLAEEARNSEVLDDQQSGMSAVKLHQSGQAGRVMITEIIDSFPVLGSGASRVSQTSTEVIPDLNLVEPVIRLGQVGHLRNTEQPIMLRVKTNQGTISPPGPVGQHVLMAGHMEMMVQPDPVVPYEETEPSVSPGLDAGQVEHLPSSQVLPGVEMSHIQPVADGPAGLVRTRHPVGTVMPPAIQDGVRLLAGGPVGQFPDPRFHIRSKNSSPDNSYQPLVTGPSGANMSDASYDTGPRLVGDPLDRSTSLDPMGPREMLSLGDGIPPASMGPVGRPWTTGQLEIQTEEPDYERPTPTRSESESDAESLHSVIRTEEEVYTGSVNTSVATGRTGPSEVLVLRDSVIFGPGAQIHRTEGGSESATVKPDPTIRMGGEGRTDDVNFDTNNGQSGSSVVSPSSDSGVHSFDEQWGCMSTDSGDLDSIQSIKTVYDGVARLAENHLVQLRNMDDFDKGVVLSLQEKFGRHDSMSYLSTNGHNSDIAAMSDFLDEEDEPREEVGPHDDVQPKLQTNCVSYDDLEKVSNSYDYSLLHRIPKEAAPHAPVPHDEDYWTKFRLRAKEAFTLDDVKLSESEYPDAVKALVFRSRWTIMEMIEWDDVPFEELHEWRAKPRMRLTNR